MGLEELIYRMATDLSFTERVKADPEKAIRDARYKLSSNEMGALRGVLEKIGSIDVLEMSSSQLVDWYRAQLVDWYKGQLVDWYKK
jgi:hypothetical protein